MKTNRMAQRDTKQLQTTHSHATLWQLQQREVKLQQKTLFEVVLTLVSCFTSYFVLISSNQSCGGFSSAQFLIIHLRAYLNEQKAP